MSIKHVTSYNPCVHVYVDCTRVVTTDVSMFDESLCC